MVTKAISASTGTHVVASARVVRTIEIVATVKTLAWLSLKADDAACRPLVVYFDQ